MRRKIEELRENLEEFVVQTDYSLLVVSCTSEEGLYVSQLLSALDETHAESLFWVFVEPFRDVEQYQGALLASLELQLQAGSAVRVERGDPPFPELPPGVKDPQAEPARRFESLLRFLPRLLDAEAEQTVVLGLLPATCRDELAFAKLIAGILPHPRRPEWLEPLRIVTLDPRERPNIVPLLEKQKVQTVLTFPLDFSTPALTAALTEDAADPSVPVPERMANMLQLAALDLAYQRHPDALEKYSMLHEYYAEPHLPAMQALCLQGAGDSLEATGEPAQAKRLFERGIELCLKHDQKVPLLQLLLAVIRVCTTLGLHDQAESYAQSGFTIALSLFNGPVYVLFAEKKGDAQLAQNEREKAVTTYDYARQLAEVYKVYSIWKAVLEKLEAEHQRAGRDERAAEMRKEWRRVDALEQSGGAGAKPAHAHA